MIDIIDNDIDEVRTATHFKQLVDLTNEIVEDKKYLLIEDIDKRPVLVDMQTANAFKTAVDMVSINTLTKMDIFFQKYGAIATIHKVASVVWRASK